MGVVGNIADKTLKAAISENVIVTPVADPSTEALITIAYEHHEIHEGSHYFVESYVDLAINHVLQFVWRIPNVDETIHFTWKIETESETLWQVYETGVIKSELANTITPLNSNRNSLNTSKTTLKYEDHATLVDADNHTDISASTLLASGISGSGKDGGDQERSHEMDLKKGVIYVLRATATAAGFINFNMQWYEHTNKN